MNRSLFSIAILFGSSSLLLLVDSAIKGALILLLAAFAVTLLRRDSAATRHLAWMVAIVAMLVVPGFSAMLPQWRVLPAWATISSVPMPGEADQAEWTLPVAVTLVQSPSLDHSPVMPVDAGLPFSLDDRRVAGEPVSEPALGAIDVADFQPALADDRESADTSWRWPYSLPWIWVIGLSVLALRLVAARVMLWSSERRGTVLCDSIHTDDRRTRNDADTRIIVAFEDAIGQLGIRQRVHLMIHAERSIPLVWGVFRHRLLLPAAARDWNAEQIRSVLLHELAHIKRRDTIAQLLAQFACAAHWFNPLVWFAAWRLHVERERACDDLVLANGVRASAYAEHLLNVATRLSSSPWTQACGLAMARNSSLEDRLAAVLSQRRNRRSLTNAVVAAALTLGASIAIPLAMLGAADDPPPTDAEVATSDEPATDTSKVEQPAASEEESPANPEETADSSTALIPDHKDGKKVFRIWQAMSRTDGKIPGALIGRLGKWVEYFIELNKDEGEGGKLAVQFEKLLPRFDATHDWKLEDAVGLLDDVAAVHSIPLVNAIDAAEERFILTGQPLPAELKNARWGKPAENGLRVAWHLEHPDDVQELAVEPHEDPGVWTLVPSPKTYELGTVFKSRILVHNHGKLPVFFVMPSWQQSSRHTARDKQKKPLKVSSTSWTTIGRMKLFRLDPGAYCESPAPGIGVGPAAHGGDWAHLRPGAWIDAKAGDDVELTPGDVEIRFSPFSAGLRPMNDFQKPKDAADLWKKVVKERVAGYLPVPIGAADRELVLRRLVRDLYDKEPNQSEIAAFVRDKSPGGLHPLLNPQMLETRVMHNRSMSTFTGTLSPGTTRFRVVAAGPDQPKEPRVATGPGYFFLGKRARLQVRVKVRDGRQDYSATIRFISPNPKKSPPPKSVEISLPEGLLAFAFGWERGSNELWIRQKGLVRRYDFSDPNQISETRLTESEAVDKVPQQILSKMKAAMVVPESLRPPNPPTAPPNAGVQLEPGKAELMQWGEPVNGLRAALVRPPAIGLPETRQTLDFNLVIQNVSESEVRFVANSTAPNPRRITLKSRTKGWTLSRLRTEEPSQADYLLQPGEVAVMDMVPPDFAEGSSLSRNLDLVFLGDMTIDKAPQGAWTGTLVTADTHAAFAAHGLVPKDKDARELFKIWNGGARWNRTIPGGRIGSLADSVKLFTRNNPTWKTTPQLLEMLPRLEATRDWDGHEAIAMLDKLAAIQGTPIRMLVENEWESTIRTGTPLPKELEDSPWGEAQPNGLRLAWLLDPNREEHSIGTPLKSRILFHNSGEGDVAFRVRNWHQSSQHAARDANGESIRISSTSWTTRGRLVTFRLKPGEFAEVAAADIGVGAKGNGQLWKGTRVGSWIETNVGDDVEFTPAPVLVRDPLNQRALIGEDSWWFGVVSARLALERPLPDDKEVRRRMMYQVAMDLFGTPLGDKYVQPFVADSNPDALDTLARRLAEHPHVTPFAGTLQSGATSFRVLPAGASANESSTTPTDDGKPVVDDPPPAKPAPAAVKARAQPTPDVAAEPPAATEEPANERPLASRKGPIRSANHSGNFSLKEGRRLVVCRPTVVKPWLSVIWDTTEKWPASRVRIYPNVSVENRRNWAVVWRPDADELWYVDDLAVTRVDITNPAEVLTTRQNFADPSIIRFKFPEQIRNEFKRLGFEIPRSKPPADLHYTDGQAMLTSKTVKDWTVHGTVTDADGKPMAEVPIRLRTAYHPTIDVVTTETDEEGNYRVSFRLDLRTIARYRGITVEPVLEGFTERDAESSGVFDALLHPGEQPQRAIVRDYPPMWLVGCIAGQNEPGPINRFSKRDLVLGQPARADFVMLPASVIRGEVVSPNGVPLPSHFVSVTAPDTIRPRGYEMIGYAKSDERGRFTLRNIPANEVLDFKTSPEGQNGNVCRSASQIFGPASTYRIRIVADHGKESSGVLRIERVATQADTPGTSRK